MGKATKPREAPASTGDKVFACVRLCLSPCVGEHGAHKRRSRRVTTLSAGTGRALGLALLLTARVGVLEVWIEAFVHELGHLVHSTGLDIVHELLQAGLYAEEQHRKSTPLQLKQPSHAKAEGLHTFVCSLASCFSSRLVCLYTLVLYRN